MDKTLLGVALMLSLVATSSHADNLADNLNGLIEPLFAAEVLINDRQIAVNVAADTQVESVIVRIYDHNRTLRGSYRSPGQDIQISVESFANGIYYYEAKSIVGGRPPGTHEYIDHVSGSFDVNNGRLSNHQINTTRVPVSIQTKQKAHPDIQPSAQGGSPNFLQPTRASVS